MDAPRTCPPPIADSDSAFLASLLTNIPEEIRQRPPSQTPAKPRQSPMARVLHNREVRENEELVKVPEEKKRLKLSRSSLIMGKVTTYQNGINRDIYNICFDSGLLGNKHTFHCLQHNCLVLKRKQLQLTENYSNTCLQKDFRTHARIQYSKIQKMMKAPIVCIIGVEKRKS